MHRVKVEGGGAPHANERNCELVSSLILNLLLLGEKAHKRDLHFAALAWTARPCRSGPLTIIRAITSLCATVARVKR